MIKMKEKMYKVVIEILTKNGEMKEGDLIHKLVEKRYPIRKIHGYIDALVDLRIIEVEKRENVVYVRLKGIYKNAYDYLKGE